MIKNGFGVGFAAAVVAVLLGGPAGATTVPSSIGSITAEQYQGNYCDDFGADVQVRVSAGLPNTTYSATFTVFSTANPPTYYALQTDTFTTDAAGNGSVLELNALTPTGRPIGTAVASVATAGASLTVNFPIYCPGNQGG